MINVESPLLPGMADNAWNRQASMSYHQRMMPTIVDQMTSPFRDPLCPIKSTALEPLPSLRMEPYISNNVGPGHLASENEYLRLQKAAFDYEDFKVIEGLKFIREHRQPDWHWQEGAVRMAEEATGLKWEPPERPQIFPEPAPEPTYWQQAQEAARKTIEAMSKPLWEPSKLTDVEIFPRVKPYDPISIPSYEPTTPSYLEEISEAIRKASEPIITSYDITSYELPKYEYKPILPSFELPEVKPLWEPTKLTDVEIYPRLMPNVPSYPSMGDIFRQQQEETRERIGKVLEEQKRYEGIELAPIVRQTPTETVFGGYGSSHFSYVEGEGFHATTQIPGFGRTEGLTRGLSHHLGITETGNTLSFQEQPLINIGARLEEGKKLFLKFHGTT